MDSQKTSILKKKLKYYFVAKGMIKREGNNLFLVIIILDFYVIIESSKY